MKRVRQFVLSALLSGVLIVVPLYLAVLLVLKAMKLVVGLVRPFASLLPEWLPAEHALSLLLVLIVLFLIGLTVRTPAGRAARQSLERSLFERLPGYALFKSLTQRMSGKSEKDTTWQPALVEIEDALVPAFIIEELEDGRYTVFVPSVPTPLAGAVYILDRARVHLLDIPFNQAIQAVSRWGSGSRELVAAMKSQNTVESAPTPLIPKRAY